MLTRATVRGHRQLRTVIGFAKAKEQIVDPPVRDCGLLQDKHIAPWRIEDPLKSLGANHVKAGLWCSIASRDGNLITGQHDFFEKASARLVVEAQGR